MKKAGLHWSRATLSSICCIFYLTIFAQEDKHLGSPLPTDPVFNGGNGVTVDYLSATNMGNETTNMKGNPCFIAEWVSGVVVFKGNKLLNSKDLQFNWVKNELHTRYNGKAYNFSDSVIEFMLLDTTVAEKTKEVVFRNGYPDIGAHKRTSFYEVVAGGANFELLRYWSKHEHEYFEDVGTYAKEFYKVADWYIYDIKNNTLQYINLKPSSIERALPSHVATIREASNKIEGKKFSETELISLINSLNL